MSDSQQRLLSTLLSGIPGILALKNSNLQYEVVNPAFCQFLGKAPQDVIGKKAEGLFPEDESVLIEIQDQEVIAKARPQSTEARLKGIGGERWFEISRSPILDDDGLAVGLLMVGVDITEYKNKIDAASDGGSAESEQRLVEAEMKLSELLNQLQSAQTKAAEAEKHARALTVKMGDMEMKVAEAERKTKQIAELNESVAAAEKRAQDAEAKIKQLESSAGQSAEVQAALQKKTQEVEKVKGEYLTVLKQLDELRAWAQKAQYQYTELQKLCKSAEAERDTHKSELEQWKATASESESAKAELEAAKQEASALKTQLEEARQTITTLEEDVAKLKQAKKDITDLLKKISPDE